MAVANSYLIQLPKIIDARGNLSIIEEEIHIPFKIASVYWIFSPPIGDKGNGYGFKDRVELMIAISGSFDVVLDDGANRKTFKLNRSNTGLLVPGNVWIRLENFSSNSVGLIASSSIEGVSDYVNDYKDFLKSINV